MILNVLTTKEYYKWIEGYANNKNLIIIYSIHVLKQHTVPHKNKQLLYVSKEKKPSNMALLSFTFG